MKLLLEKRLGKTKSELTQIRFRKDIPAIIYTSGKMGELATVKGEEFQSILRKIPKGHLSTTIFEFDLAGKKSKAIIKEVQYHPTSYQVLHLDFLALEEKTPINVHVPLLCVGEADCVGIKLGGFLRQPKRHIKVSCLPKDLPSNFTLDVRNMGIEDSKRVRDLEVKKGVKFLVSGDEVVAVIAKR